MDPIIFERADVKELAGELIKCGACIGENVTGHLIANWANFGPAVIYVNSCADNDFICPSRIAHPAADYIQTRKSYLQRITENAIATVLHEMHENCSIRPVLYRGNENVELREMEESYAAFEYIKNRDFEFVHCRAVELGADSTFTEIDNENQLTVNFNGIEKFNVKFRVYYGDQIIGEIN